MAQIYCCPVKRQGLIIDLQFAGLSCFFLLLKNSCRRGGPVCAAYREPSVAGEEAVPRRRPRRFPRLGAGWGCGDSLRRWAGDSGGGAVVGS